MSGTRNRTNLQSQGSVVAEIRGRKFMGFSNDEKPKITQDQIDIARKLKKIHRLSPQLLVTRLGVTLAQAMLLLKAVR